MVTDTYDVATSEAMLLRCGDIIDFKGQSFTVEVAYRVPASASVVVQFSNGTKHLCPKDDRFRIIGRDDTMQSSKDSPATDAEATRTRLRDFINSCSRRSLMKLAALIDDEFGNITR